MLRRRGKDLAALVPIEDLKLIQRVEDEIDVGESKKALADMKRKGLKPVAYDRVRARLRLK